MVIYIGIVPIIPMVIVNIYLNIIHSTISRSSYSNRYPINMKIVFPSSSVIVIEKILLNIILFFIFLIS